MDTGTIKLLEQCTAGGRVHSRQEELLVSSFLMLFSPFLLLATIGAGNRARWNFDLSCYSTSAIMKVLSTVDPICPKCLSELTSTNLRKSSSSLM